MTLVAALGDSFTCGEGVGVRVDPAATWVALVAGALPGGRLLRLAEPGARVTDVRTRQLPRVPGRVDVATLLVGLNDVGRSGWTPDVVGELRALVAGLRGRADVVLLGRLHDPAAQLPLPAGVARTTRARLALLNAAVDELGARTGVCVLDLGRVPALAHRGGWAVDRIHPAAAGHRGMAAAACAALRRSGWPAASVDPGPVPRGPSRRARARWAVRHGLPYAAGHLRDVGAPLLSAALRRG
ncbi:GDSL-type esterase/lipase family protein [Geodermatophilus sp. SYSU D00815]